MNKIDEQAWKCDQSKGDTQCPFVSPCEEEGHADFCSLKVGHPGQHLTFFAVENPDHKSFRDCKWVHRAAWDAVQAAMPDRRR
jgi:hypothetical protein